MIRAEATAYGGETVINIAAPGTPASNFVASLTGGNSGAPASAPLSDLTIGGLLEMLKPKSREDWIRLGVIFGAGYLIARRRSR